ncbi:MAG: hypothetical protein U0L15_00435 [Oscillospiraceae bacterium]|jgi:hypothetical protein|nr:hypothetical protein [Oscillospiraceae bacterium]
MGGERNPKPAGGMFLPQEEVKRYRNHRKVRRWPALAGLILGDGLLIYMIQGGLIDLGYGVVILAGISAYFGNRIR